MATYAMVMPAHAQVEVSAAASQAVMGTNMSSLCERRLLIVMTAKVLVDRRQFTDDMAPQEHVDSVRVLKVVLDQLSQLARAVGWEEYSELLVKQWDAIDSLFAFSSSQKTRASAKKEVLRLDARRKLLDQEVIRLADTTHCSRPSPALERRAKAVMRDVESAAETYVQQHPVAPIERR